MANRTVKGEAAFRTRSGEAYCSAIREPLRDGRGPERSVTIFCTVPGACAILNSLCPASPL
jgi:hypothetical protein